MEIFIYIFALFFSLIALFFIVEKPYYMLGVVVFLMIYRFNVETPLPLDARGLLIFVLFIRLFIFDKENATIVNNFLFTNKVFLLILLFTVIVIILPIYNSEKFTHLVKDIVLNMMVVILGFLATNNVKGKKIFIYSILAVSFLSSLDLIYTYYVGGGLNIVRVIDVLVGKKYAQPINHNYPGMLATFGMFFVYLWYVRNKLSKIVLIILGVLFLAGLFLSTSRSALLAVLVVFIIMNLLENDLKKNIKKFIILGFGVILMLIIYFFAYNLFLKTPGKTEFVDKVYYRLYDEPMQMLGLKESAKYDIYTAEKVEGSIAFRINKWQTDFKKYQNLELDIQLLGLGPDKYATIAEKEWGIWDNLKRQTVAHNGYLLIIVERGIIGLSLYLIILFMISKNSVNYIKNYQLEDPIFYLFIFIAIYSFAQNSELVSVYSYLILGGLIGDFYKCQQN